MDQGSPIYSDALMFSRTDNFCLRLLRLASISYFTQTTIALHNAIRFQHSQWSKISIISRAVGVATFLSLAIDSSHFTALTAANTSAVPRCKVQSNKKSLWPSILCLLPLPDGSIADSLHTSKSEPSAPEPPDILVEGTHCNSRHCPWTLLWTPQMDICCGTTGIENWQPRFSPSAIHIGYIFSPYPGLPKAGPGMFAREAGSRRKHQGSSLAKKVQK